MKSKRKNFISLLVFLLLLGLGAFCFYCWIESSSQHFYQQQAQIIDYTVSKDTEKLSRSQVIRLTSQTKPVFLNDSPKLNPHQVDELITKTTSIVGPIDHLSIIRVQPKVYYDNTGKVVTTWLVQGLSDESEFDFEIKKDMQLILNFNWTSDSLTPKADLRKIAQNFNKQLGIKMKQQKQINKNTFVMMYPHQITYQVRRSQTNISITNISNTGS